MTVLVALLRGINVGGRTTLPMADLRELAEGLGYTDVRTYIQSGNLVLSTTDSAAKVERDLAKAVADRGGVAPDVAVRTRAQLAKVVDTSPFLARGEDPAHLHVLFLIDPKAKTGTLEDLARDDGEELATVGQEVHLLLPHGVGRSKLALSLGKRGPQGTMRNWRTVTKLVAMATEP
jgi:uncharacterized protein (DUF1697 family)